VVLLTTSHRGADNVMTMPWHTMMEFDPPLVGCVVAKTTSASRPSDRRANVRLTSRLASSPRR